MANPTPRPDPTCQPPNFGVGDTYSWVKVRGLEDHRDMYARATYCTNLGDLSFTLSATDVRIGGVEIVDNDSGLRCDVTSFNYEDGSYNALRVVTQDIEPVFDGVHLGDTDGNTVGVNANTSSLFVDVTNLAALTAITQNEFDQTQTLLNTVNTSVTGLNTTTRSTLAALTAITQNEFDQTQTLLNTVNASITTLNTTTRTNLNALTALTQSEFDQTQTLINNEFGETQTLLLSLTSLQEDKQNRIITLLHQLTANTDSLEVNTDDVELLLSDTNVILNSLTAVDFATTSKQNSIITLLDCLTAKQTTINLDVSAINLNTDEVEKLFRTSNTLLDALTAKQTVTDITGLETRLDVLTAVDFATSAKQVETNSLLNGLTAIQVDKQDRVITLLNQLTASTDTLEVNTGEVEILLSGTNVLLNSLTAVDYSTATKQDTIITLLDTLTAKETTISLDVSAININTNEIEKLIQTSNTLLNALTAREYDININAGDINVNTDELEGQFRQTLTLLEVLTSNSVFGTSEFTPQHVTGYLNTTIVNQPTGTGVQVSFADTSNLDAFGRLRVSNPKTLLDAKHLYDKLPLTYNEFLSGTATSTFSANDSMVIMSTFAKNDSVIRQTRHHFNYQPGKSIQALFTGKLLPEAGIIKRVGLFQSLSSIPYEPSDGMYLEVTESGPSFNVVKRGEIYSIPRSQWNIDKLDGTGNSTVTIDFTAAQIFIIDYEWLGVGRARFGFMQSGKTYYAHYEEHKNNIDRPYITSPNQPVRYEIRQNGDTPGSMFHICATVMIEGGEEDVGKPIALVGNKIADIDTNYKALVAIRLKDIAHDSSVILKAVEVLNTSTSNAGMYDVILNPTVVSVPFVWEDISNTALQQANNIGSSINVSGGYSLFKGFTAAGIGGSSTTDGLTIQGEITKLGINIDSTSDVVVLAGKAFADNQKVELIGMIKLLERS